MNRAPAGTPARDARARAELDAIAEAARFEPSVYAGRPAQSGAPKLHGTSRLQPGVSRLHPSGPTPPRVPAFLTVAEVALILRVSKMTVYRLLQGDTPQLRSIQVGRSFRIPESEVIRYAGLDEPLADEA